MVAKLMPVSILAFILSMVPHEYHFTHTKVVYDESSSTFQISLKIPAHDLENALERQGAPELHVGTDQEHDSADSHVREYVQNNLHFQLNGKKLAGAFLGYELGDDYHDLWCYLEVEDVPALKEMETMRVKNTLLTNMYADQSNLVTIELTDSKQHRLKMNPDKTSAELTLSE